MPQIYDDIIELLDRGMSADLAVGKILSDFSSVDDLSEYVFPAVLQYARKLERRVDKTKEGIIFKERIDKKLGRIKRVTDIRNASFRLGNGRSVPWAKATVEEHEARIAWQRAQIHAIQLDITRHEKAITLINQHSATCLDDIAGWENLLEDD